ncbi:MAG: hypothetical protein A3G25_09985 [Betaproteobacteria bacterium RIFCSPLOWO2_12_FULL_63_13]|nr:MAG: hypothetical protein A3G25_09985 [Betaproteobacteria bacterium RIFCSPLOWO2_12_FULL_63_13]
METTDLLTRSSNIDFGIHGVGAVSVMRPVKRALRALFFFLPDPAFSVIVFEMRAFLGNLLAFPLVLDRQTRNYVNLGSGPHCRKGYTNIDFFGTPGIDYGADLRRPLKISDGTVDGIFCEHVLEHLTYAEVSRLLGECYRVMKPGSVLRVIVPDVSLFVQHYSEGDNGWFERWETLMFIQSADAARASRRLVSPMQAVSFVTQEYGHVSAWDFETLSIYLTNSGFGQVKRAGFMQGQCSELFLDKDDEGRKFVSLYTEAVK